MQCMQMRSSPAREISIGLVGCTNVHIPVRVSCWFFKMSSLNKLDNGHTRSLYNTCMQIYIKNFNLKTSDDSSCHEEINFKMAYIQRGKLLRRLPQSSNEKCFN